MKVYDPDTKVYLGMLIYVGGGAYIAENRLGNGRWFPRRDLADAWLRDQYGLRAVAA